MSRSPLTILVTGATGTIGTELIHLLATDPVVGEIRAATRHPDGNNARLLSAANPSVVKPVAFDDNDETSLAAAFRDVDVLCLIVPLATDMAGWQDRVLVHASRVRRVVKVSVDAAHENAQKGTIGGDHWHGEERVRGLSVEQAIVRPTLFMQHFMMVPGLYSRGDDTFYLPIGDAPIAMLDARDIAAVVAAMALCDPQDLPLEPMMLTGPEALNGDQLRERLSWATGRKFFWNKEREAFEEHSDATGSPKMVGGIYQAGAEGAFSQRQTEGFERLVGRLPHSFARFVSDYASFFAAPADPR